MNQKKKPKFNRSDANKGKKFGSRWNKPMGMHNKLRLNIKSHGSRPSPGYGAQKTLKFLVKGLKLVKISSAEQLSGINAKSELIVLDGRIGTKKKIDILERISKLNVPIFNVKDVKSYLEDLKKKFEERKKSKKPKEVKTEVKKVKKEVKEKPKIETKVENKK